MPSYTSFGWSLGTTSFRTREFNLKIERQLELLTEFWALPETTGKSWSDNVIQTMYYDFIKAADFIKGDAGNKPKDAREKTSGLVDIGLIDGQRKLTAAGKALLDIVETQSFASTNQLRIDNDSYAYLKQLCKTALSIDGGYVRPYLITAYVLSKVGALSYEEFTYLLPFMTNADKLSRIVTELQAVRTGTRTVDDIITDILMEMPNYQEALAMFLSRPVTQSLMIEIGINRKSGGYDAPYFDFYTALKSLAFARTDTNAKSLVKSIAAISGKPKNFWKRLLLKKSGISKNEKETLAAIDFSAEIFLMQSEKEFRQCFFRLLHLYKAKSTLSDYFDLNRRYFKITDTLVFRNGTVDFDIIPKCYFTLIADKLLPVAFTDTDKLFADCSFAEIVPHSDVADTALFAQIERFYGIMVRDVCAAKQFIEDERISRFNDMIDSRFTKEILIDLLAKFENRDDEAIQNAVTANADIPTIFEYIVGIIWYNISERKVNILHALNLSLDADLLPKTHAKGGGEDITFKYAASPDYPNHTALIEVTLSEKTNQRRMEMEPVSRHLGDYLLKNKDENAYCVFVSTYLHINVKSDFRGRKNIPYYSTNNGDHIDGMKIIPCQTTELRTILDKDLTYACIYRLFEAAYQSTDAPNVWYENNIIKTLEKHEDF
ncbi:MAG: AlwI family type II restriction endonuclease [Clostridiales bacterium]|jgi:hypothetical protein|nr:AlwI family type II restriction endonuclease [Clostridiales bacterium]